MADLGTAVVLVLTAAVVFFVAGLDAKYVRPWLAAALLLGVAFIAAKPYRLARIIGFCRSRVQRSSSKFDPQGKIKDVRAGFADHARSRLPGTAVEDRGGRGRRPGPGLMQGKQKLLYLPEAHTDFIYAVVGEELGLWGCTAVLAGFLIILWRGLRLFFLAPTTSAGTWRSG